MAATTSREEAPPGARASRPHTSWHSLGQLLHRGRPATVAGNGARTLLRPNPWRYGRQGGGVLHPRETERIVAAVHAGGTPALPGGCLLPGLCFGQAHGVTAGRVAGCYVAGILSGSLRQCMRAGRPRSRGAPPPGTLLRPSPWCYGRQGGRVLHRRKLSGSLRQCMRARRPRSRGAPPPGALLWPSPWCYGRQGGGVLHRRETERNATAVHAGGTPAFPGGASSWGSASAKPMALRPAGWRCATSQGY